MKKTIILLSSFLLTVFNGCEKESNPADTGNATNFKINFVNNRIRGNGWVVLHSLDGKSVQSYKSFIKNAAVDFGNINSERVTFTYIDSYTDQYGWKNIIITSDLNAPAGEWQLDGNGYSYKGKFNITMNYPNNNYRNRSLGIRGNSSIGYTTTFGQSSIYTGDIYYIRPDTKLSIFSSIITANADSGLCGWISDANFNLNETNTYSLTLDKLMNRKMITTSKPFQRCFLEVLSGDSLERTGMSFYSSDLNSMVTNFPVFYYSGYPRDYYYMSFSYSDMLQSEGYSAKLTDLPSNVSVPNLALNAIYNADSVRFENLITSGSFDQYAAAWSYVDATSKIIFSWIVYAPHTSKSVNRPFLPTEVINQIPPLDLSRLKAYNLGILDYDTMNSMDEIITKFFKSNTVPLKTYNVYHYYRQNFQ